jgi:2-polyprenyl-3-methyl-5-hydroxy-6-metoxy-1,4-benzoquinol methylase
MKINRVVNQGNDNFRHIWVKNKLELIKGDNKNTLLDVGAGLNPYKDFYQELGWQFKTHDFSNYIPKQVMQNNDNIGLHDNYEKYPKHDYVCDIQDIPETEQYDLILLTEVLEHVPDPVATLKKLHKLLNHGGYLVITVPSQSLIHQAPYYFSSGLSQYWFIHHSNNLNLSIKELLINGDYSDFLGQELSRTLGSRRKILGLSYLMRILKKFFRFYLSKEINSSSSFGVYYVAQK